MKLPLLPPSTNQAYTTIFKSESKKGKKVPLRVLTKEGRAFKKEATAHIAKNHAFDLARIKKNAPYILYIRLHVEALQNKGWPEKAENRYKKLDATNRLKLLEDVLAEVTAVDDSCFVMVVCEKRQAANAKEESCDIWMWNLDEEGSPFENAALTL